MSGIGAFNRIPIHHIIRGGGFDRRKKRKSKKEQYSNRKKINNPESTENGVNRDNDISDESSDSDQPPKKKRPHSTDMHTLNGNLINPESDCTIENDIEKLTVNNTTPKNVQKNTKGRPSINLRGSAKASGNEVLLKTDIGK